MGARAPNWPLIVLIGVGRLPAMRTIVNWGLFWDHPIYGNLCKGEVPEIRWKPKLFSIFFLRMDGLLYIHI